MNRRDLGDRCDRERQGFLPERLYHPHRSQLKEVYNSTMSVEDSNMIDAIARDSHTKNVVLLISDHLDWNDVNTHLEKLIKKIDVYMQYVANGEINDRYPDYDNNPIELRIAFAFPPPDEAKALLKKVQGRISELALPITIKTNQETF